MATVLIASLGDSPVVVTAMFDLLSDLLQKEQKSIDQLKVFYPANEFASVGYEDLILPSLQKKCAVQGISLDFEDVSGEDATYNFLHKMYLELDKHQKNEDIVYLSLAGGRKSMATLMALLAPLFTCVKKLYHILDKDEGKKNDHFLTTGQLHGLPPTERQRFLFPSHERVNLISIPYAYGEQHLNEEVKSLLYAPLTDEQLDTLWEQDAEEAKTITYYNQMNKNNGQGKFINVELTKAVVEQYREMRKFDVTHAKNFAKCFYQ